jgi:hypothetical protein
MPFLIVRNTSVCYERNPVGSSGFAIAPTSTTHTKPQRLKAYLTCYPGRSKTTVASEWCARTQSTCLLTARFSQGCAAKKIHARDWAK